MTYLVGKIALDIKAGAPNNGEGRDNVGQVKKVRVGRDEYPYVSAQAFRRWLRDSAPVGEARSEVIRSGTGKSQQAFTKGRPDRFFDDDLFGYMVAQKGKDGASSQRDTVFATGTLLSVAPRRPTQDFGTMSRGFQAGENPVIHNHELYTAELAGDVLLDLPRIGTFETEGSGFKVALHKDAAAEVAAAGAERLAFRGNSALRLSISERRRRAALLLRTLTEVRGGAKKALHYGDRSPAFVLLAPIKGGINPFTRVFGLRDGQVVFNSDVFLEELAAWREELDGPVHIGWAPGFLGDGREIAADRLKTVEKLEGEREAVVLGHPRTVFGDLADQIEDGTHDHWFDDPTS
ncbi:type I-B CRISPR-associated protein Cas7/Cst2/DevR [Frankia sp. AgKG'84/4]|uniref:type I-B CRISPR-associated protein Cas7/Cst2/DevR n=1 Tax=Frankia sp. AgKG'84/4 TaxID=573490 RepID=UPI00200CBC66|nr:type I-B CRISPR-associated protein Cas7/Cst2/DevR [Frankia sp. AgKG'84/4]MCL9793802.1 type I-B CRISPR-associated protein Cas7/Cst2/DevR [Frankia sp. AgKG'84/4]